MASTIHVFGNTYHYSRAKNGGQFSGPCPESGGTDRFIIEPATKRWMCRQCSASCTIGHSSKNGAYRYGTFSDFDSSFSGKPATYKPSPRGKPVNHIEAAKKFQGGLTKEIMAYLHSRGLSDKTIRYFRLGGYSKKAVTIPMLYHEAGEEICTGIKRRWLPKYRGKRIAYQMLNGHSSLGLFNRDALHRKSHYAIIGNSLFDVMLLHQIGYVVVGPFAGEASWYPEWTRLLNRETILNLEDWDAPSGKDKLRPGTDYALRRALKLSESPVIKNVITSHPPDGITDISAMFAAGEQVELWIWEMLKDYIKELDNEGYS